MQGTQTECNERRSLQRIKELRLMDDDFFQKHWMERLKQVEYILNTILECDDIKE